MNAAAHNVMARPTPFRRAFGERIDTTVALAESSSDVLFRLSWSLQDRDTYPSLKKLAAFGITSMGCRFMLGIYSNVLTTSTMLGFLRVLNSCSDSEAGKPS